MRISQEMTYRSLNSGIAANQAAIYDLQRQISSGRRVNRPSDDPGSYEIIKRLHSDVAQAAQFARNSERVEHDLVTLDGILQKAIDVYHRAEEIAIRASDGTASAADRQAMADEVDQLYRALLDLANTSEGGRYIFAGLRTDTQPYTGTDIDADGHIDYYGSEEVRMVEISKGIYIEANIPGSGPNAVFQSNIGQPDEIDLFANLTSLRDSLRAGQNPAQTTAAEDLNKGLDHLIKNVTTVGARQERVAMSREILYQREINIQDALETEESLDIAQAVTALSQKQSAYEAALRVTAGILGQKSLLDWI